MMRGLPGSGKTTRARELVTQTGNSARVNRDDLRAMLFYGKWSGKREAAVIAVEKAIAHALLVQGLNPIIDDTNLLPKHLQMWSQFAKDEGIQHSNNPVEFVVVDKDTSREECIANDFGRAGKAYVGQPVINRMAAQSHRFNWGVKPIAIFDIDGTLADGSHREHLVTGEKKNWKAYFNLCGDDKPVEIVVGMLHALRETHMIVVVSGRPDTCYPETFRWFVEHDIPYDAIFMRAGSDKRPDTEVKQDILNLMPKERIAVVFDDRPRVIRMWRENGIRVIPVRGACEEF
jgi:predicted kinase